MMKRAIHRWLSGIRMSKERRLLFALEMSDGMRGRLTPEQIKQFENLDKEIPEIIAQAGKEAIAARIRKIVGYPGSTEVASATRETQRESGNIIEDLDRTLQSVKVYNDALQSVSKRFRNSPRSESDRRIFEQARARLDRTPVERYKELKLEYFEMTGERYEDHLLRQEERRRAPIRKAANAAREKMEHDRYIAKLRRWDEWTSPKAMRERYIWRNRMDPTVQQSLRDKQYQREVLASHGMEHILDREPRYERPLYQVRYNPKTYTWMARNGYVVDRSGNMVKVPKGARVMEEYPIPGTRAYEEIPSDVPPAFRPDTEPQEREIMQRRVRRDTGGDLQRLRSSVSRLEEIGAMSLDEFARSPYYREAIDAAAQNGLSPTGDVLGDLSGAPTIRKLDITNPVRTIMIDDASGRQVAAGRINIRRDGFLPPDMRYVLPAMRANGIRMLVGQIGRGPYASIEFTKPGKYRVHYTDAMDRHYEAGVVEVPASYVPKTPEDLVVEQSKYSEAKTAALDTWNTIPSGMKDATGNATHEYYYDSKSQTLYARSKVNGSLSYQKKDFSWESINRLPGEIGIA